LEKIFVVKRVAAKLHGSEAAIDTAMVQVAEMMGELVQARKDLGLSATVAAGASAKVAAAVAALSEARSAMVAAHAELDETRLRLGVRTKMMGWEIKLSAGEPVADEQVAQAS
jgi:hypothetical protein